MTPLVGFVLAPDPEWLGLIRPLIPRVELFVVTPETLWKPVQDGLRANSYHREFLELRQFTGRPFAAHSVAMSPGSPTSPRRDIWLRRMREDHAHFSFAWWTDHHGVTELHGRNHALPRPLIPSDGAVDLARRTLDEMASVVPLVGLETSWFAQLGSSATEEARFLRDCTASHGVLLDLHNLWAMATNLRFDVVAYLEALGLERVIEIHVSGGRAARDGTRLDSHDTAVPEPVFQLLEQVAPRCPALRAITLERFERTVGPEDVPVLAGELDRIRAVSRRCQTGSLPDGEPRPVSAGPTTTPPMSRLEEGLIAKLRFERLIQGDDEAHDLFDRDPQQFVALFRRYDLEIAGRAWFPNQEGQLWRAWRARHP